MIHRRCHTLSSSFGSNCQQLPTTWINSTKDMIIANHGVLHLLVTSCTLIAVVCVENETKLRSDSTADSSRVDNATKMIRSSALQVNEEGSEKSANEMDKSQRRAPRFDTAASSPWVRMYNRPPGTQADAFYNYETRGNTSAHTSGEAWDAFKDTFSEGNTSPIEKGDVKVIKDILRVKPKSKDISRSDVANSKAATDAPSIRSTNSPSINKTSQASKEAPSKGDNRKKGYIVWSSSDGGSNTGWSLDDNKPPAQEKTPQPNIEQMIPKDGSHWKVVGEGGEDGWQVVDDKGEVEWKIEYDDGEWKVTSTGDVPGDTEWVDPEYVWGPSDGSLTGENDYTSWSADDYRTPSEYADPQFFFSGLNNDSSSQVDSNQGKREETRQAPESGVPNDSPTSKEILKFGIRRKVPSSKYLPPASSEESSDSETSEAVADAPVPDENPQNKQGVAIAKSWNPGNVAIKGGPEWVQGYGSKTWESENSGWNRGTGEETWIATNKNNNPWVPKVPGTIDTPQQPPPKDINTSKQDSPFRAWGTGYGSKTWKGNAWDSNVVWKTGFNGELPGDVDNSTWKFPQSQPTDKKKPQAWSQPIPSEDLYRPGNKNMKRPSGNVEQVQVKWPGRPVNRGDEIRKRPPHRRTGGESWSDDDTVGGVFWKQNGDDMMTTTAPEPSKPSDQIVWQNGGWKVSSPDDEGKSTPAPWKSNSPPKGSKLISVAWNAGGNNPTDSVPVVWNQGPWAEPNGEPSWIFSGCKMTLKCGSRTPDVADDSTDQTSPPDMPEVSSTMPTTNPPPTTAANIWPSRQTGGKSWKPPTKSWRPPKWKQPTPAPTTSEPTNPTMPWKSPPPVIKWKKPSPPPNVWNQPPPTMMWTEETPAPSWKPPPPPPPPMRWKKGPKPTKSWRPPPTKSWKPPAMPPTKSWQPPIATPQPDMWPTTKPDCKDTTEPTQPTTEPDDADDSHDTVDPPQIIIITKLPKGGYPNADDKRGDSKKKIPFGPWLFPPRRNAPSSSKNRKDRNILVGNSSKGRPIRPTKTVSKLPNIQKGWPKGMPPPNFVWPSNSMRRWTTKGPTFSPWKYAKYSKSKTWRQMFKKWMNGR